MLHLEVSKLWSKNLIQCYTNSKAKYDAETNTLSKQGEHLKLDDGILRRINPDGKPDNKYFSWKVVDLIYQKPLSVESLTIGGQYGVYVRKVNKVLPFKLVAVDLQTGTYKFQALENGVDDVSATAQNLPPVYLTGTKKHK